MVKWSNGQMNNCWSNGQYGQYGQLAGKLFLLFRRRLSP
jgi:hypothetical protein